MFSLVLALVLLCGSIPMTGFAKNDIIQGVAFITGSSVRLRSEAGTGSKILDTTNKNEVVVVLSKHGDWYKVIYDLKEGYIHGDYLKVATTENVELGYGRINGSSVNLRSGAGTSHSKVARGNSGDKAYIIGVKDGWYKVIFGENICYIRSDYLDLTEAPYENKSSSKSPKFYRGGKSLGTEPSASALNGSTGSANKEEQKEESKPSDNSSSNNSGSAASSGVKYGIGFTTGSGLRLRTDASTSSKTIDSANKGEVVIVLDKVGAWYKVIYDLQEGYMHGDYLRVNTTENAELGYGKVNTTAVNLRSGPGTSYGTVDTTSRGEKAYIIGINNGWYKVIYGQHVCYVRSDFLDLTEKPYENKASAKSPKFYRGGKSLGVEPSASALKGSASSNTGSTGSAGSTVTGSVTGSQIVGLAKQNLGVPYKWGGTTPSGFDCSGFVYYVLNTLGIKASRTLTSMYKQGTEVSKSQLQPGDIVFFKNTYKSGLSHVGIYVGGGQFIHSPHSGKVVSYADLNSDYYTSHYYGAVRFTK